MKRLLCPLAVLCLAVAPVQADVVFSDNFDTDSSANWTYIPSTATASQGDTPNDSIGSDANVFFDYSSVGVPSAPNSAGGTTRGMWFTANMPGTTIFSGVTMMLNSQTFDFAAKPYRVSADVWLNHHYHPSLAGTTQEVFMGVGASNGASQFPGDTTLDSAMFATSTDGDTGIDWRAYKTPWPGGASGAVQPGESGVYASDPAGANPGTVTDLDNNNPYYQNAFPGGHTPPASQSAIFPNQANITVPAGTVSFAWHRWTIETTPNGGPISWYVSDAQGNDVLIATIQGGDINPYTLGGGHVYFGMFDTGTGSAPLDFFAEQLLFGLVDNVLVEDLSVVALEGDVNGDGVVNLGDINFVTARWLNAGAEGDANGDGTVNLGDINYITARWLNTGGAAAAALTVVPEPASLSLLALGAVATLARRRRA